MNQVRWLAPSPLWDDLVGSPAGFRAPALLRFAGDDFIPQFQGVLGATPNKLRELVARPESWRDPAVGLGAANPKGLPLRLYQPVHGHFYLVAASLACRVPGLPEHTVDAASGEIVAFVVRRITVTRDSTTKVETETGEQAWVKRADGFEGWAGADGATLTADEELIPMFGTSFPDEGKLTRRVFAGLVPVSRREAYVGGREEATSTPPAEEPRLVDFQRAVIDPWVEMEAWWEAPRVPGQDPEPMIQSMEASSALILLDFAEFLERSLPDVWNKVQNPRTALAGAQLALYNTLDTYRMWTRSKKYDDSLLLREALSKAHELREKFDELTLSDGETQQRVPDGFSPVLLVDPDSPDEYANSTSPPYRPNEDFDKLLKLIERPSGSTALLDRPLAKQVSDALQEVAPTATRPQLPALGPANPLGNDWFAIRCVYLRPNCGRKSPVLVSARTERFKLASFFEPDAPARQLRVALPVDTSPATLRKYDRNVAFMLSDQLRKQMSRASGLKDLMEGKAGAVQPGLDIGVICSFSIPIITICALILLMIIVSLLNIIFWWLPLFRICFPLPSFKAKG